LYLFNIVFIMAMSDMSSRHLSFVQGSFLPGCSCSSFFILGEKLILRSLYTNSSLLVSLHLARVDQTLHFARVGIYFHLLRIGHFLYLVWVLAHCLYLAYTWTCVLSIAYSLYVAKLLLFISCKNSLLYFLSWADHFLYLAQITHSLYPG
jgi:hypothetical protein